MGRLDGRRFAITGAASGMGRAIAALFAAEGAGVALLDRNLEGAQAAARTGGGRAFRCDVSDRTGVQAAIAAAAAALDGLDGVVNGAGILDIAPFGELSPESFDRMVAVNLTGAFNVAHAALPHLQAAERATIVTIASVSALTPMAGTVGYSASKAGVLMMTKCLAFDLGPAIRANAICPGVIQTEMTRYIVESPEHAERAASRVALKRLGVVDDVANAALFFSSEASGFTTGAMLPVDGGFAWR